MERVQERCVPPDTFPEHLVPHLLRVFNPGTYRYPISFAIPADSPPSLDCTFGSIVWIMTATVHRPGRLVPRMKAVHTINVVATPGDDATDENLNVTQTWKRQTGDDQMAYSLSVFGKTFPIGSKIPIQIKLLPFVTVKVHRVSVAIDGVWLLLPNKTSVLIIASPSFNRACHVQQGRGITAGNPTPPPSGAPRQGAYSNTPPFPRRPEISAVFPSTKRPPVHGSKLGRTCLGVEK